MERKKIYDQTIKVKGNDNEAIKDCARHLIDGEVVAFPTETVYGLGCNAFSGESVKKVFEAKGRPSDNPLICHIWDKSQISEIASEVTPVAQSLVEAFMPGPVTVIMRKSDKIPSEVTAGLDTVGIRMPSHPVARRFLEDCGCPVAAPSANISGRPSPTTMDRVIEDMDGFIYAAIDGGPCDVGLESTVIDATGEVPVILRPGAVTREMIVAIAGSCEEAYAIKKGETPRSPGMKYRHYAPSCDVEILDLPEKMEAEYGISDGRREEVDYKEMSEDDRQLLVNIAFPYVEKVKELIGKNPFARVGIYAGVEVRHLLEAAFDNATLMHIEFYTYGKAKDVAAAAHYLFEGLRDLDLQKVDLILAQGFPEEGLGVAYMNRLTKSSAKKNESDEVKDQVTNRVTRSRDEYKSTYTAQVLFVDEKDLTMAPAAEIIFDELINREGPFKLEADDDCDCELYGDSAGLTIFGEESPDPKMVRAVSDLIGRDMSYLKSKRVSVDVYNSADLILTMRDEEAFRIVSDYPDIKDKVFSLSTFAARCGLVMKNGEGKLISVAIPDPAGENDSTYAHTAKALAAWIELIFPYILKDLCAKRA
ncbi:MAG: threonylcarbamoyl-AMP synthase [Clostridiales bacterium]|nr:threonylcarbamoyl-AMP synthase [Clostridiales bacterium]